MLSSTDLKKIVKEARPLVEQQLDLAEQIAGLREVVTASGGDWSQLKALIKAQVQDERDDAGDGKRVRKILDRADYAKGYADMLGLAKLNDFNFSDDDESSPADDSTQSSGDHGGDADALGIAATQSQEPAVPTGDVASRASLAGEEGDADRQLHSEIPAGSPVSDDRQPAQVAAAASADHRLGEGPEAASREPRGPAKADAVESASEPHSDPLRLARDEPPPQPGMFKNSNGIWRQPGCQKPDTCAGMWNKRCYGCSKAWQADHPEIERANFAAAELDKPVAQRLTSP